MGRSVLLLGVTLAVLAPAAWAQPAPAPAAQPAPAGKIQTTSEANSENVQGAMSAPLRDLNVVRTKIPPVLLDAMGDPYLRPTSKRCAELVALLAPLSIVASWAHDEISDTDRYVETVTPLASNPAVQKAINDFFAALPKRTPFAVADIPLLFETARDKEFDAVIVVACPRDMQIERVMERNKLSREDTERRLAAQLPIDQKIKKATYVIRTDGTFDETNAQVDALIASLTAK